MFGLVVVVVLFAVPFLLGSAVFPTFVFFFMPIVSTYANIVSHDQVLVVPLARLPALLPRSMFVRVLSANLISQGDKIPETTQKALLKEELVV